MTQITQIGSKKNLRHLCNLRLKNIKSYSSLNSEMCIRDRDRNIGKTTERAQIIQTTHMVIVFVCHQYAGYLLKRRSTQHLVPEVRTTIYQYHRIIRMQQG